MSNSEDVWVILLVVTFVIGILLIISGIADMGSALKVDNLINNPLDSMTVSGVGVVKAIMGLALVLAVIAPQALKVIISAMINS
jgi:uncharacterized membrane protein HdeD (DUF308 family)